MANLYDPGCCVRDNMDEPCRWKSISWTSALAATSRFNVHRKGKDLSWLVESPSSADVSEWPKRVSQWCLTELAKLGRRVARCGAGLGA